ncbi:MAG: glycosyltransferase family 4 protein [Cyclobacteriaceae bacterium]|nr:glycosyltransferase family 4 protein [Cyclobacteriaceae bacterium]
MISDKRLAVAIYSVAIPSTTFIERLIIGLANEGLEVVLFGKFVQPVTYTQSSIIVIGNRNGLVGLVQYFARFIKLLLSHPARYVALRNYLGYGPLSGKEEFLKWKKYVPVLLRLPDIFHIQWARSAEEWIFLKKLFDVKLVLSFRGTHINAAPKADSVLANSYRKAFKHFDAFHAVSYAMVKEAVQYGVDESKVHVIYSGLPYRLLPETNPVASERIRILVVGRFHWKKGYQYLFDALHKLKSINVFFSLTLVAQGELPHELLFQLHDLNLSQEVSWIKGLSYQEVENEMLTHDVLVLPSIEEGIANVVLEAMQLGLLVVSTDCGGMKEVILNGENGFIVPVRNPQALAEGIISASKLSHADRTRLRQRGWETVTEQFNLNRNIPLFVQMYEGLKSCA